MQSRRFVGTKQSNPKNDPRYGERSTSSRIKRQSLSSSATRRRKSSLEPTGHKNDDDDGDEIKFINVPSVYEGEEERKHQNCQNILPTDILKRCGETDYREVYEIDLRQCHLSVVPNLEKFSKVRLVDLSSNYMEEISRLECCSELRELKLYDNQLAAIEKIDALSDLVNLQLQHNRIQCIGRGLVNCRKLMSLRLDCNRLLRIEVKEIAALARLTQLDLSNNRLEDVGALSTLPNLQELAVANNRLRSLELSRCKKIRELDISGNRISDLNCVTPLSNVLLILNASRNAFGKLDLSTPMKVLEEMYVSENTIKRLCNVPRKFPELQILDIRKNKVAACEELAYLRDCRVLRELCIADNLFNSDLIVEADTSTDPLTYIPSIQVLDGVVISKPTVESKVPVMRPMSASNVLSSRQVHSQLNTLETEMRQFQQKIEESFSSLRTKVGKLDVGEPRASSADRPVSRASRRSRIAAAQAFASNQYSLP